MFVVIAWRAVGVRLKFPHRFAMAWVAVCLSLIAQPVCGQLPAFSGAEGYGGTFTGSPPPGGWFSNATVYHVTNLNDSGPGSLRGAFVENSSNKIIVFDVAGTIHLTSGSLDIKNLSNYYIAGQTAPGPVTVYGNMTQITHSPDKNNSNVILRYLTFRTNNPSVDDPLTFAGGSTAGLTTKGQNMIIDHVSTSWGKDENLSVANYNTNVSVQYSIISDATGGSHAYGSLVRPRMNSSVSFHHNLYANNASRNPRPGSYFGTTLTFDFRNNVIYNWSDRAGYTGGSSDGNTEFVDMNYVGNYAIAGPATPASGSSAFKSTTAFSKDIAGDPIDLSVYQYSNLIDPDHDAVRDGSDTGWGMFRTVNGSAVTAFPESDKLTSPVTVAPVTTQSADNAYSQVVNYVGNWWWNRDAIDARIVGNVQNNTQPAGGVPATAPVPGELSLVTSATPLSRPAGWDTDSDGMPNNWELAHGLNPNSSTDFKLDGDGDGYVNLQDYLDEVGAFPAPTPLRYVGPANGASARYALITNWEASDFTTLDAPPIVMPGSNWQPSRFDEALITSGTVTVDSAGQHAGALKILGPSNPTLIVSSGWLKVENDLLIGGFGVAGELNLTGGTLRAKTITRPSGAFNFLGGKLSADTVNFSLTNHGGTLAPGDGIGATQANSLPASIGQTHIVGDLALVSGALEIELSSPVLSDTVLVEGNVSLGGSLNVVPLGGFTPSAGNSWQIMTAEVITGQFSSITAGFSVQNQGNRLVLFFGSPVLAGDYNGNGVVDAADYVAWRQALADGGMLLNETVSPGLVDQADYDAWRANFGAGQGNGSARGPNNAVPEPAIALLLFLGVALQSLLKRPR